MVSTQFYAENSRYFAPFGGKRQKISPFLQFFVGHFPSRQFYRLWLRFYWHFHFLVRFGSASGLAKSSNPTGKITLFGRRPTLSRTKMSKSCKKYNIFCIFDDLLVRPDDHLAQQKQYIFVGHGPSWDSKSQNIARNITFFWFLVASHICLMTIWHSKNNAFLSAAANTETRKVKIL